MQSSSPELLGSFVYQLVYETFVLDAFHTHVFSSSASVPPIHTMLPLEALNSSSFSSSDCTIASCVPFFKQASLASLHDLASSISVYCDDDDDEVEARSNGKNCGTGAAPTDSSAQKRARYLSRRGPIA